MSDNHPDHHHHQHSAPLPPARSDSLSVHPRQNTPPRHGLDALRQKHQMPSAAQDELRKKLLARSGSQLNAPLESTVDDLPPPPPPAQLSQMTQEKNLRERDENEFEQLVQSKGLLGALGFGEEGPTSAGDGGKPTPRTPPRRPSTPPQPHQRHAGPGGGNEHEHTHASHPHLEHPQQQQQQQHPAMARPPRPAAPRHPPKSSSATTKTTQSSATAASETPAPRQLLPAKKRGPVPAPPKPHRPSASQMRAATHTPAGNHEHREHHDGTTTEPPPRPPARGVSKAHPTTGDAGTSQAQDTPGKQHGRARRPSFDIAATQVLETYSQSEYTRGKFAFNPPRVGDDVQMEALSAHVRRQLERDCDIITTTLVLQDDQGVGVGLRGEQLQVTHLDDDTDDDHDLLTSAASRGVFVTMTVSSVVEGGAAYDNGNVRVGDILVSIGDEQLLATTHERAVTLLQSCEGRVLVVLARKRSGAKPAPTRTATTATTATTKTATRDDSGDGHSDVATLRAEVESLRAKVKVLETAATNAGRAVDEKAQALTATQQELARAQALVEEEQSKRRDAEEQLREKGVSLATMTTRAQEAEARVAALVREVAALKQQVATRDKEVKRLQLLTSGTKGGSDTAMMKTKTKTAAGVPPSPASTQTPHLGDGGNERGGADAHGDRVEIDRLRRALQEEQRERHALEAKLREVDSRKVTPARPAAPPAASASSTELKPTPASTTAAAAAATASRPLTTATAAPSSKQISSSAPPVVAKAPSFVSNPSSAAATRTRPDAEEQAMRNRQRAATLHAPPPRPKPKPKPPLPSSASSTSTSSSSAATAAATATATATATAGTTAAKPVPAARPKPRPRTHTLPAKMVAKPLPAAAGEHGDDAESVSDAFETISSSASDTLDVRAQRSRAMSASRALVKRRLPTRAQRARTATMAGGAKPAPRPRAATTATATARARMKAAGGAGHDASRGGGDGDDDGGGDGGGVGVSMKRGTLPASPAVKPLPSSSAKPPAPPGRPITKPATATATASAPAKPPPRPKPQPHGRAKEAETGSEANGSSEEGGASSAKTDDPGVVKRRGVKFSIGKSLRRLSRRLSSVDLSDSSSDKVADSPTSPSMKKATQPTAAATTTATIPEQVSSGPGGDSDVDTSKDVDMWRVAEVCAWLSKAQNGDFAKYADSFREQGIDGPKLLQCDSTEALKGLGVTSIGHRTILKKLIADLQSA